MRILEVIPLLSIDGGAESFVVYLCNELIRQGHECAILTLYDVAKDVIKGVSLSHEVKHYSANKKKGIDLALEVRVRSVIKAYRPDVVHVHVGAIPYITLSALTYRNCKYFATIHSEARREAGGNYTKWSRQFLFKTNLVTAITISENSQKSFEDFYRVKPALIYNGVPSLTTEKIKDYHDTIRFIHVARCHPVKNQELLLKAFSRILKKHSKVELVWYGTSTEYPVLFETLKTLLNDKIHYMGSTKDARGEMMKADALCLSSKIEGMPMTIIEALSVGCVPICTPVGGCINMIKDGYNGFLAADMSIDAYSNAIERFISLTTEERQRLRQNAIVSFNNNFSIEKTVTDYLTLFASIK